MEKKTFLVLLLLVGVFTSTATVGANTLVDAGPDQTVYVGQTVAFSGTAPADIRTIEWDFDDGSPVVSGTDPSILTSTTHVYTMAGTYTVTLRVEVDCVVFAWESDTCTITVLPPPIIESALIDSPTSWITTHVFSPGDDVCVTGDYYLPSTSYDVQVVNDVDWHDGMAIPAYVAKTAVVTDILGMISDPRVVWSGATPGKYDIVVDVDENGFYNEGVDALDDNDIEVTAGFFVIPEYWLGTILGLVGCFAALGVYRMSKREHP